MIKCIYREDSWAEGRHCDSEADYVYIGKSYCAGHMEIRSSEMAASCAEEEKRTEELRKQLRP